MNLLLPIAGWALVAGVLLYGNHRWRVMGDAEPVWTQPIPVYPPPIEATRPAVTEQAEIDATRLASWTYIPVDLPSVPLSWAEQEALNDIERREFTGGAA